MKTRIQRLHQQKGYYKREVSSIIEERDKYVPKLLYESGWREERIKMGNDRVCCFVYHVSLTGKSLLKQRTLVITRWKNMTYGNRKLHLTWQKEMGEKPHRIFSRVANGKEKSGFAKGMDNTILFYELKNQHKPLTLKIAEEKWKQGYNGFIVAFATKNAIIFCEIHGLKLIIIGKQLMSREFYGKLKRDCLQQKNTIPAEMLDHGFLIYENEEELESWFKKWINEVN